MLVRVQNAAGAYAASKPCFDRSGKVIVAGYDDCSIKAWSAADGRLLADLAGHTQTVSAVLFDPAGKVLYSCSDDCTYRVWQ